MRLVHASSEWLASRRVGFECKAVAHDGIAPLESEMNRPKRRKIFDLTSSRNSRFTEDNDGPLSCLCLPHCSALTLSLDGFSPPCMLHLSPGLLGLEMSIGSNGRRALYGFCIPLNPMIVALNFLPAWSSSALINFFLPIDQQASLSKKDSPHICTMLLHLARLAI